jgi:hypothetical protein
MFGCLRNPLEVLDPNLSFLLSCSTTMVRMGSVQPVKIWPNGLRIEDCGFDGDYRCQKWRINLALVNPFFSPENQKEKKNNWL